VPFTARSAVGPAQIGVRVLGDLRASPSAPSGREDSQLLTTIVTSFALFVLLILAGGAGAFGRFGAGKRIRVRRRWGHSPIICSTTSRRRPLVSNSMIMICCQVPRVSAPSTKGIVSDGPSSAARTWLDPLSSPQRR